MDFSQILCYHRKMCIRDRGITVLFVTHDISEALKLGTKVLVMDKGEIQQYDAPGELVRHPATDFVKKLVDQERRICHLPEDVYKRQLPVDTFSKRSWLSAPGNPAILYLTGGSQGSS